MRHLEADSKDKQEPVLDAVFRRVLTEIFERRARGERFNHDMWLEVVTAETGPDAGQRFESLILRGETLVPRSEAFGPCFERAPARLEMNGSEADGFRWVRRVSVPDARCRAG